MAGGRGADLLRMKIFSERYDFRIDMKSSRCGFIPQTSDICPGRISECDFCETEEDCYQSGGTTFSIFPQHQTLIDYYLSFFENRPSRHTIGIYDARHYYSRRVFGYE